MNSFLFQKEQINCQCFDSSPKTAQRIFRTESYHSSTLNNKQIQEISVRNQSQPSKHKKKSLKKEKGEKFNGSQKDPREKQQFNNHSNLPQIQIPSNNHHQNNQYRRQQRVVSLDCGDGVRHEVMRTQRNKQPNYVRGSRGYGPIISEQFYIPINANLHSNIASEPILTEKEYEDLICKQFQRDLYQYKNNIENKQRESIIVTRRQQFKGAKGLPVSVNYASKAEQQRAIESKSSPIRKQLQKKSPQKALLQQPYQVMNISKNNSQSQLNANGNFYNNVNCLNANNQNQLFNGSQNNQSQAITFNQFEANNKPSHKDLYNDYFQARKIQINNNNGSNQRKQPLNQVVGQQSAKMKKAQGYLIEPKQPTNIKKKSRKNSLLYTNKNSLEKESNKMISADDFISKLNLNSNQYMEPTASPNRNISFRGSTVSNRQKESISKRMKNKMQPKQIESEHDGTSSEDDSDKMSQVLGRGWDGLTEQRIQLMELDSMIKQNKPNTQTMITQQSHIKNSQIKTNTDYSNSFISPKSQYNKGIPFGGKYGTIGMSYQHIDEFGKGKNASAGKFKL